MHCQSRNVRERAFTLVELLVVIGILAALIALLLPALSKARVTAQRTACGANMKQVAMALQLYLLENRGNQPLYACRPLGQGSAAGKPCGVQTYKDYLYPVALSPYLGVPTVKTSSIISNFNNITTADPGYWNGSRAQAYLMQVYDNNSGRRSALFCPMDDFTMANSNPATPPTTFGTNGYVSLTSYGAVQTGWDARYVPGVGFAPTPVLTAAYGGDGGSSCLPPGPGSANLNLSIVMGKVVSKRKSPSDFAVFGHLSLSDFTTTYLYINTAYTRNKTSAANDGKSASYCIGAPVGATDLSKYPNPMSHGGILPWAYADGHVEMLAAKEVADVNLHGPASRQPLWYNP